MQGKRVFYHKVIVESESGREIISVRCSLGPIIPVGPHQIHRRDLDLPVGFQEPEWVHTHDIIYRLHHWNLAAAIYVAHCKMKWKLIQLWIELCLLIKNYIYIIFNFISGILKLQQVI